MAELRTLARPYAKAVFGYAHTTGSLDQWSASLELLSSVIGEAAVQKLLAGPRLTKQQQAATIIDLCGDALGDKAQNLVVLLADNRRLPLLPFISAQFRDLKAAAEKTVDVEIVSASALDDQQHQQFSQALSARLDRRVNISVSIDKSLIGGVLIRAGDTVIDGSLRGRLTKLAQALNS
jgi:F-type H+-transporting ATPase subunit delta